MNAILNFNYFYFCIHLPACLPACLYLYPPAEEYIKHRHTAVDCLLTDHVLERSRHGGRRRIMWAVTGAKRWTHLSRPSIKAHNGATPTFHYLVFTTINSTSDPVPR